MKKALTFLCLTLGSIAMASAQVQITIGAAANQGQVNGGAILSLLGLAQKVVSNLVPFAIGVAVLAFFWYLIQFILQPSAENKKQSLHGMGYAVLALFVMVSIWGIVGFFGSILGINQGGTIPIPGVPSPAN